jgi:hypothetical protein
MSDKDLSDDLSLHLLPQIQTLIDAARKRAAVAVNAELTLLYWRVGKLLNERILQGERASYGQQVMQRLALDLTAKHGKGWSKQQLLNCLKVAQVFPDEEIVYALCIQLSWTHIRRAASSLQSHPIFVGQGFSFSTAFPRIHSSLQRVPLLDV